MKPQSFLVPIVVLLTAQLGLAAAGGPTGGAAQDGRCLEPAKEAIRRAGRNLLTNVATENPAFTAFARDTC